MPRISKEELARRAQKQVRVEKAIESLTKEFRRLLAKHSAQMFNCGSPVAANAEINIAPDGNATLRLGYQTRIEETASFALDDGENDLPFDEKKPPQTQNG